MQVRDWLYVEDHCRAIRAVMEKGREGEIYNIGGSRSLPNLEVIHKILAATGKPETLLRTVEDRPGHDRRYALSSEKLMHETGWKRRWIRSRAAGDGRVVSAEYRLGAADQIGRVRQLFARDYGTATWNSARYRVCEILRRIAPFGPGSLYGSAMMAAIRLLAWPSPYGL